MFGEDYASLLALGEWAANERRLTPMMGISLLFIFVCNTIILLLALQLLELALLPLQELLRRSR